MRLPASLTEFCPNTAGPGWENGNAKKQEEIVMINMNKKKNKRIMAGVIAGILVVCMVVPTLASAIAGWLG